jgi:hypothetical protein
VILGGQWHWGGRGTEFGGFDIDGAVDGQLVQPADQVYLWLSYYF